MRLVWIGFLLTGSLCLSLSSGLRCQAQTGSDRRPVVAMMIGEAEYETERTLPAFAKSHLEKNYKVITVLEDPDRENSFPGVQQLGQADVLVVSVRRKTLPPGQLEAVRRYVREGKPVIGIRTANHAFCLRNQDSPEGTDAWPEFDADVFGGNYRNHYPKGSKSMVIASKPDSSDARGSHSILAGLEGVSFEQGGTLYQVSPIAANTVVLMTGVMSEGTPVAGQSEPLAWTFQRSDGGKSFYTSLGHPADFENPSFQRLLKQAIQWAASSP